MLKSGTYIQVSDNQAEIDRHFLYRRISESYGRGSDWIHQWIIHRAEITKSKQNRVCCGQAENFMENKFVHQGTRGSCSHQIQRSKVGQEHFNVETEKGTRFSEFL